jgi:RHS repeat-associated protein
VAADRSLTSIAAAGSPTVSFSIDALGRHASQTISGTETTYAYLGTSNSITTLTAGSTTYSIIDAVGNRLATSSGGVTGYLVPDLHGNVAASVATGSNPSFLSAFRYDAYGETCDSYNAGGNNLAVPWRYQGRIRESASSATDLYDFGARSYDPSLGAFTSFDSVSGSALNPLSLNRYLYALANPASLIDPTGHSACKGYVDSTNYSACYDSTNGGSAWTESQATAYRSAIARQEAARTKAAADRCAKTADHAAGCGPRPDRPNAYNTTSPALRKLSGAQVQAIADYADANGLDQYGRDYIGCVALGYGPGICEKKAQAANDGKCHSGMIGCFFQGGWDTLTSPITMVQCAFDDPCARAMANKIMTNPLTYIPGRGPAAAMASNMVADFSGRTIDDVATGNWEDLSYQGGSVTVMALTAKAGGKLMPKGAEAGVSEGVRPGAGPLDGLPRVGSALKLDSYHSFPDMVDGYAGHATATELRSGVTLYQLEGSYRGKAGRFEWIVDNGQVTHRCFVEGGTINGVPSKQ